MDQGLGVASTISLKAPEWLSAYAVLMEECEGTAWKFQGVLVDFDEQPRTFTAQPNLGSPKRGHSETTAQSVVMNVHCLDLTGPVTLTLWEASCEDFQRALQSTVKSSPTVKKWYVTVQRVRVQPLLSNASNGTVLTPMRTMHSIAASPAQSTSIKITAMATSPFLFPPHEYIVPNPPHCINNFQQNRAHFVVPFRATFRGTVVNVVKGDITRAGDPKTTFALVDSFGAWLPCCATGRHALSAALVDGTEIVAYNVFARANRVEGKQPCVWLFKDSTIVPVGTSTVQKRVQIDFVTA